MKVNSRNFYTVFLFIGVIIAALLSISGCSTVSKERWSQVAAGQQPASTSQTATVRESVSSPQVISYTIMPGDEENTGTQLQVDDAVASTPSTVYIDTASSQQIDNTGSTTSSIPPSRSELRQQNVLTNTPPSQSVVYFDFDSSSMSEETKQIISEHTRYLQQNTFIQIRLEGHADERGSREYNLGLGELRARAVYDLLVLGGVNEQQLYMISYGEERPSQLGHNEDAWRLNRRVEIVY